MKLIGPHIVLLVVLFSGVLLGQNPEIVLQQGHKGAIEEIAFNEDGSLMATGSKDLHINIIDPYTGLIMSTLRGHTSSVIRIIFSGDKRLLVSGSSKEVIVWDLEKKQELFRTKYGLKHKENLAVSFDSKFMAYSRSTYKPEVFHLTQSENHKLGDEHLEVECEERFSTYNLQFTKSGNHLLIGGKNGAYRYNLESKIIDLKMPTGQLPRVNYIDHEKNEYFAANNYLNWQNWSLKDGKYLNNFEGKKGDDRELNKSDFAIINDQHSILGISSRDYFSLYNLKSGEYLRKCEALKAPTMDDRLRKGEITAAAFNPRGELLVVATEFEYYQSDEPLVLLRYFDVSSGREIRMTDGFYANVNKVAFSPDDKKLAITGVNPTKIWSLGKAENCIQNLSVNTSNPINVYWSPDSKVLLTYGRYIKPLLTDLNTGDEKPFDAHFYYTYGLYTGTSLLVSDDFKVLMGTNRAHHYYTGEIFCEFDLKKDYYRKEIGDPSMRDHPRVLTPDNTLIVMEYNNYSDQQLTLTFIDLNNCKKSGLMDVPTNTKGGRSFVRDNYKIRLSKNGKYIAIIGSEISIVDVELKQVLFTIPSESTRWKLAYNDAAFNYDESLIGLAGVDGKIHVWSIPEQKEVFVLEGHQDEVTSLSFKHKKNTLASAGLDDKVMLWNLETGKEVASMVNMDANDYIVTTPSKYYFSSKDALKNAAFKYNNQMLPFEQFDLKYNRPDKVIKQIGTASIIKVKMYQRAYQKRLRKSGFTEEMLGNDFNLPELKVKDKYELLTTTSNAKFSFKINAQDKMYALNRIMVYINDVPAHGPKGLDISTSKSQSIDKELSVELSAGLNKVQVSVINEKGVESIRDVFEVAYDKEPTKPDLYLLAIGISQYDNASRNLTYAAKDAQDIAKALEQSERYNEVHVKIITNKDATKEAILKEAKFLEQSKIDDHVVLYISSHGLLDDQLDYYLATTNVDFNNPSEKGLPYGKVEEMLENVLSRNRLVLIDACHSGEIDKEEMMLADANPNRNVKATAKSGSKIVAPKAGLKNSFSYMQALFSDVSKGLGATVISAAGGMEFAYETGEKQNGIFTHSIIEGLQTKAADINKDNQIQLTELQLYIQYRVSELSGGLQIPTTRKINSYNDFIIY